MKVKILGSGCAHCGKLEENTELALNEMNKEYEIVHVRQISKYAEYGVAMTPALVINGEVIVSGRVPDKDELITMITKKMEGK